MVTKQCPVCDNLFIRQYNNQRYCTPECFHKARIQTIICAGCNTPFETERKDKIYCTPECGWKHRPTAPINQLTKQCEQCKKDFQLWPSESHRFCSVQCSSKWLSEFRKGENNPAYIGGTFRKRGTNWITQRKLALKRDKHTCQRCKKKNSKTLKLIIDVHHIKPYRLFKGDWKLANDLSNLITLCRQCHVLVEKHGHPCPLPAL